jgi:hypothetical protein
MTRVIETLGDFGGGRGDGGEVEASEKVNGGVKPSSRLSRL